jgi:hypothetical protein
LTFEAANKLKLGGLMTRIGTTGLGDTWRLEILGDTWRILGLKVQH